MKILTSCEHIIEKVPDRYQEYVNTGTTFDCPQCGSLQVMEGEVVVFKSKSFHQWMHDQSVAEGREFVWPADGKNTGYIDIETTGIPPK